MMKQKLKPKDMIRIRSVTDGVTYAQVHAICPPFVVTVEGDCHLISGVDMVTKQDIKDAADRAALVSRLTKAGGSARDLADRMDISELRVIVANLESRNKVAK